MPLVYSSYGLVPGVNSYCGIVSRILFNGGSVVSNKCGFYTGNLPEDLSFSVNIMIVIVSLFLSYNCLKLIFSLLKKSIALEVDKNYLHEN